MKRTRRILIALLAFVAAGLAVLHWGLDLRVSLDGSGRPRFVTLGSSERRARALERHRAAQRAAANPSPPAVPQPVPTVREEVRVAPEAAAGPSTRDAAAAPSDARVVRDDLVSATSQPIPGGTARVATHPDGTAEGADPPRNAPAGTAYWTGFRGPLRDGHYRESPVRTAWPDGRLEPLWQQLIGGGYASFAVARGRAFTIEQRRGQEVVAAYDVRSGRELWAHGWDGEFREFMGGDGPRATPAWADGLVYALGALGELRCLDEGTGRLAWRTNILRENGAANLQWGMAASPLIVDDTVVVLPGGPGRRSVVAYDRRSGQRRWSSLDDKQAYASPMLATIAGTRQIIVLTARRLVGVTPDRGDLLWQFPWVTQYDINAAQPIVVDDRRVLVSSGYGQGAALVEIARVGERFEARAVWQSTRMKNRFASSVLHDGHIYGLDEAILACIDVETGSLKWKGGRYGYGQMVLAGGNLIVLTEDGDLALVRATPERFEELARFSALSGKTWNHPAIEGGLLLVRNLKEMAAFDLRPR